MKQPKKLITALAQPYLFRQMEWETFIMIRELLKHNWTHSTGDLVSKNFMVRFQQQNKLAHTKIHHSPWKMMQNLRQLPIFKLRLLTGNLPLPPCCLLPELYSTHAGSHQTGKWRQNSLCQSHWVMQTWCSESCLLFSVSHFHALPNTFSAVLLGLLLRGPEFISLSEIFAFSCTFT